ncbi:ATP-binding protein [Streptomyces sp. TRM66268-LWL]|uniref:ATP-binding protein n=1 Tax=Streptomyces polyasparticus TaxID=2767826 RepID=A0ABR7SU62_9ACTN|nr:ATP-binding protein [Streptomyces polyasparticus]MBC9717818.1 ATP-binding protein [Streptomyces polyasparticus]
MGGQRVRRSAHLSVGLPFDSSVAAVARKEIASLLGEGVQSDDSVVLVCSELATNAYCHGSEPIRLKAHVEVTDVAAAVEITVTDGGAAPRARGNANPEEFGRGWLIVSALAAHSALDVGERRSRAWCRLLLPTHRGASTPGCRGPKGSADDC